MTEIRLEKSLPSEQERVGSQASRLRARTLLRQGGVDPLPYAFEGKIAVHPGLGGSGVEKQDFEATLEPLLAERGRERPWRTSMCRFVRRTACTAVSTTRHTAKTKAGSTPTRSFRSCACGGPPRTGCRAGTCRVHGRRHAHGAAGGRFSGAS